MSGEQVAEPPQTYDFKNWDAFIRSATRYHNEIHPDDQLVNDRIATLRGLMTERVLEFLSSFMLEHPRYQTLEGWNYWTENVRRLLLSRDSTITSHPDTLQGWLSEFGKGKMRDIQLWRGLDKLVVYGDISSAAQRQYFWDAQSLKAQEHLIKQCSYFDPHNEVWDKNEPGAREISEQKVAQVVVFSQVDYELSDRLASFKRFLIVAIFSATSTGISILLLAKVARGFTSSFMTVSMFSISFVIMIASLLSVFEDWCNYGILRERKAQMHLDD